MKSKKRENSTESSSSSSSSSSSDNSNSSSSDSESSHSSSHEETKRKQRHEKVSSSKRRSPDSSQVRKREHSVTQSNEDNPKKQRRDEHPKHSRSGNDQSGSSYYHSSKEGHEHHRKERYRSKDDQSRNTSRYEDRLDRKRNFDDKRRDGDRYRRYGDRDSNRYDYHDRKRNFDNYKQGNSRERNRDDEDRRSLPKGSNRFKNDNRRENKFSRNRRDRSRSFDHSNAVWGKQDETNGKKEKSKPAEKEKPNFGLSGKLTEETNTYRGIVIKYSEPPEARKPKRRWRLYPFKGEKALQTLYIHRESAYLIGRERKVVDLPVDHPSCSKQHAALQYRLVPFTREDGSVGKRVRPYLIDLDSANGTYINNKRIEPKKYVELLEKDVIKFGYSSREYVLLHENSKDEALDDDVKQEEEEVNVKSEPVH